MKILKQIISSKEFKIFIIILAIGLSVCLIEIGASKFTFKEDNKGNITFDKEKLNNKRLGIK